MTCTHRLSGGVFIVTQLVFSAALALQWTTTASDSKIHGIGPDVLAAAQTSSPSRQARMRFEAMDRDNDGAISREEWRGSDRSFEVHDWNGDGRLAGNEVRLGLLQSDELAEADHDPSRAERYLSWTETGFNNLDHDRDRRITSNEWHFDQETFLRADRNRDGVLSRTEFLGGDMDDDRGDRFDDLDDDGDNRIERGEWHASDDAFEWLDRNGDGVLSRVEVTGSEDQSESLDQFASLDYNRDGEIARHEWHWSRASFNARDLNRDGVLSRREFQATADEETATTNTPRRINVRAQQEWTDTGLTVRAGDVLAVQARGSIQLSPDSSDTATPAGSRTGRRAPSAPASGVAENVNRPGGGRRSLRDRRPPDGDGPVVRSAPSERERRSLRRQQRRLRCRYRGQASPLTFVA